MSCFGRNPMSEDSEETLSEALHAIAQDIKERDVKIRQQQDSIASLAFDLGSRTRIGLEQQAEIECLRNELAIEKGWVQQYRDSYGKYAADIAKQQIEIEKLRESRDRMAENGAAFAEALLEKNAEIERMKYQLGIVRKSRDHWLKKYTSLKNVVLKELDVSDAPEENNG